MTKDEKTQVIRAYWRKNQGLQGATNGARAIAAQHGIPVNTVRGLQNKLYRGSAKPWGLPPTKMDIPPEAMLCTCPQCGRQASGDQLIERDFGFRRVYRGEGDERKQVLTYQSFCRECRKKKNKEYRARIKAARG